MDIITCSTCGFTATEVYFNVEFVGDDFSANYYEAECPECGDWTTL